MFKPVFAVLTLLFLVQPKLAEERENPPSEPVPQNQSVMKCEDAKVKYSPFQEAYAKNILWNKLSSTEKPPAVASKEYSPERDSWKIAVEPDFSKPGPFNHTIYFGADGSEEVWKLTILDVRDVRIEFLTEKLVFGQVWVGRIVAVEFVLDLQQHKFIYREMAQYGAKFEPCQ
jgi:hypothetical protein